MSKSLRVLVIDDSVEDAALLIGELRRGGYDPTYERVSTVDELSAAIEREEWDIAFGDYSMPHFNGVAALRMLREREIDIPFIFVSGTIAEEMAVEAMENGAKDYVMKGNLKRLLPVIHRELHEAALRKERKRSSRALKESEERLRMAINAARMYTWDWEIPTGRLIRSGHFQEVYGADVADVESSYGRFLESIHPEDRGKVEEAIDRAVRGEAPYRIDFRIIRSDGDIRWLETQGEASRDAAGNAVRMIGVTQDITERRQTEELIHHMAFYDSLTGLPNRNQLYDRLLNLIRNDDGRGKPFSLLLMDLDHFKEINETLGHHRGDILLHEVGARLKSVLFQPDQVARLGGDEFAVLLPHLAKSEDIYIVIRKIEEALVPPLIIDGLPIAVEASIGAVVYPDHGDSAETLLQRADVAMYDAKRAGVGYRLYAPSLDRHSPQKLALMAELREAIEQEQIVLYYQPKVSLKTRKAFGVEALVRWRHPQQGMILPDRFIGPAEQTGLIHTLTHWVLETAMRQSKGWEEAGLQLTVSVNLSARNLLNPRLPDLVAERLRASGVSPDRIRCEITESAIMTDPARAQETLVKLHEIGIRLSIDDFGIGYSSLRYLQQLPVDRIKVDKSFVIQMIENEGDAKIVRSTIDLAHHLGLEVVGEGVETEEIFRRLSELGCDAAQGYFISHPLPAEEVFGWFRESPWGMKQD